MGVTARKGLSREDVAVQIEVGPFGVLNVPPECLWPDALPKKVSAAVAFEEFLTACDEMSMNPFTITVTTPNPHWTQEEALFPDQAPSKTIVDALAIPVLKDGSK